ncbi:MAG: undecaprenyl/decaprenyl-phosphate alpha-N-acetylglucosaminyl 1-phosphate transferase [Oscillospiraceae bacterium]|nr:undecaprenyl/decaprenyl-phosphate alpha-N-acetylglucosaminyl 1-phosphate transferase [Oscillospiraceae bacterium]
MILDLNMLLRVGAALLVAGLLSYLFTPLVKLLAKKVGAMDVPKDNRRMHDHPIPRMGGLAIFIGFLLSALIFTREIDQGLKSILLGAIVIVILGVFDDRRALGAKLKLAVQLVAAAVVVFYGDLRIDRITNPFGGSLYSYWDLGVFAYPITIIWIVAITNAVNFIDGLDGLACGVSCISSLNLLVIALLVSDAKVAILMAALTGACLGFVPYNFNPAKIFMGDTGSTFLGFMLATVSIQGLFKAYTAISFIVPFLLLGLPIFDICFAVIRRIASGHSPMEADRGHFHHRLIDMGFSQKQSVAIAYVLTGILGLAAVLLTVSGAMKTLIMLGAILVVGAIGMRIIMGATPRAKFWHHVKHGGPDPRQSAPEGCQSKEAAAAEAEPAPEGPVGQEDANE